MAQSYNAADIEVLSGLDPVRRRPGMYTDTSRPNHLAHEVVDNSVDEALSGAMNDCAVDFPSGDSEVAATGLATLPSVDVKVPRLAAAPEFVLVHSGRP